jgi:hypothetical protein
VLFLLTSVFIVFPTKIGPHPSSSSLCLSSGKSGQKVNGSISVGGIELAIFGPTVEKNLLNVFAISTSLVDSVPLIFSSVILCEFLLRLAASLRISQVFFELWEEASASSKYCVLRFLTAVLYVFLHVL